MKTLSVITAIALLLATLGLNAQTNLISAFPNTNGVNSSDLLLLAVTNAVTGTNKNIKVAEFMQSAGRLGSNINASGTFNANTLSVSNWVTINGPQTNTAPIYVQQAGASPSRVDIHETNKTYSSAIQGPLNLTNNITHVMPTNPPPAGISNLAVVATTTGSTGTTNEWGYVAASGGFTSPTAALFDQIMHNGTTDIKRNPSTSFYYYDDFVYASATTTTPWSSTGSGGIAFSTAEAGHPFIINIDCATTVVSKYFQLNNVGLIVGAGQIGFEAQVRIPDLSDASEEYSTRIGLIDTSGESTDGVYFKYDRAGTGVNWFAVTSKAGSRTSTDTTVVVTAAAWHTLKIIVNDAGTSATFYINGSSVVTTTTNLPDTTANGMGPGFGIVASAGATAAVRRLEIDWMQVGQIFSTPR